METVKKENLVIDAIAFESDHKGYYFKATYLHEPKGESLVEISKDGNIVKEFLWPSYKIWNIAAHADDIVVGLENQSDEGLYVAGSTGLGGDVYNG